jgi:hypothetical protein
MQPYELEAWLGDNHGLTDEQLATLLDAAGEIQERYPKPDDQEERDAALAVAYRILLGQDEVLEELAKQLAEARAVQARSLAGIRQAAHMLVPDGSRTESGFARQAGVDRQAVRKWLGKKD